VAPLDGVGEVTVEVVWEPAWNISMASDEVQKKLMGM
jgi:metal-sulfur cluster biosynthetic enzyme